jgi:hypothetical protein
MHKIELFRNENGQILYMVLAELYGQLELLSIFLIEAV